MKNASSLIMDEIDTRPVIAPVLDLSDIKKNSSQIKSYVPDMNAKPGALSYNAARAISIEQEKTLKAKQIDTPAPSKMEFVQNNYSPKPLTALEIYQNTRNQLSLAKEFLSA
jgi:hypothetical protein